MRKAMNVMGLRKHAPQPPAAGMDPPPPMRPAVLPQEERSWTSQPSRTESSYSEEYDPYDEDMSESATYDDEPYSEVTGYDDEPYSELTGYDDEPYSEAATYDDEPYSEETDYDEEPYSDMTGYDDEYTERDSIETLGTNASAAYVDHEYSDPYEDEYTSDDTASDGTPRAISEAPGGATKGPKDAGTMRTDMPRPAEVPVPPPVPVAAEKKSGFLPGLRRKLPGKDVPQKTSLLHRLPILGQRSKRPTTDPASPRLAMAESHDPAYDLGQDADAAIGKSALQTSPPMGGARVLGETEPPAMRSDMAPRRAGPPASRTMSPRRASPSLLSAKAPGDPQPVSLVAERPPDAGLAPRSATAAPYPIPTRPAQARHVSAPSTPRTDDMSVATERVSTPGRDSYDSAMPAATPVRPAQRSRADHVLETRSGAAPYARPHAYANHAVLRDEPSGRRPELIDPFVEERALDRLVRPVSRPESIEPSLFDEEAVSGQPSSPLMPRSGPLSGQRVSDGWDVPPLSRHAPTASASSGDFFSVRSGTPIPGRGESRRPRRGTSATHLPKKARAPPPRRFRDLEHKVPTSRSPAQPRTQLARDARKYLLTPSVAPTDTETETEDQAQERRRGKAKAAHQPWLVRDLAPEQVHYFLREMVSKELTWESERLFAMRSLERPQDSRRAASAPDSETDSRADDFGDTEFDDDEDIFRRDVYDPETPPIDLPLMRFLLRNVLCTCPLFVPPPPAKHGPPPPSKAAMGRRYFFTAVAPILREVQARSLSAGIDRRGETDGMPFMAQSFLSSVAGLLHKWATRYMVAVLRVGPGNPYYPNELVHSRSWPWPHAKLLPPEAFVCYRRPTDRLRAGGFEVDIVAVREHAHRERDFVLRIRRPNRMDEFVVRNDRDWEEFRARLAHELGPYVHVRPLPRLPGRPPSTATLSTPSGSDTEAQSYTSSYLSTTGTDHDASSYMTRPSDDDDDASVPDGRAPPPGLTATEILQPLYGARARSMPRFEVDRRLLRSWMRDTLAIRSVCESSEVRAFLSIGCFHDRELDTDELLNIAERRRVDGRRIEEREKDAEMAGETVLSMRRVQMRIWLDCVEGDGFLKMYDALKATPTFAELPSSYQMMVSWGHLQAARFLYGVFVQSDQSRANLLRVRDVVDAVPWRKLAHAMRLPVMQCVAEWQKQFLRNKFLQSILEIAFEDNPVAMDDELRALQQDIGSDTMIRKLRMFVDSPGDFKRLVRQHAHKARIPLVAAIVRGSDAPKLSKVEVQRVMSASREYTEFLATHPNALRKKTHTGPGYMLIIHLQRVLRLYSLHRDVAQIRGMLQDPAILDALTVLFEPFLEALVRMHRIKGIREDIQHLHVFLLRLLDLLESLRARVQDPARSINTLASFLDRGAPAWYDFLHRWSHVDPFVFSTFAWLRHMALTIGAGSDDLASIWTPPASAMQDTDDVGQVVDALESTHLATPDAPPDHAPPPECKVGASLRAEIEGLAEAARRKRGRQMEIASRWAAGDTEADFSIQVFGDGEGRMRRDPFLPKEPLPAPPTDNLSRLLRSFREAVSSALYR